MLDSPPQSLCVCFVFLGGGGGGQNNFQVLFNDWWFILIFIMWLMNEDKTAMAQFIRLNMANKINNKKKNKKNMAKTEI